MAEEEYIRRDKLYNNLIWLAKYQIGERQQGILGCAETVRMCQAADVAPVVHGQWVTPHWHNSDYCYNCSKCGGEAMHREYQWARNGIYPICPNCGAKMDGGDGDAAD